MTFCTTLLGSKGATSELAGCFSYVNSSHCCRSLSTYEACLSIAKFRGQSGQLHGHFAVSCLLLSPSGASNVKLTHLSGPRLGLLYWSNRAEGRIEGGGGRIEPVPPHQILIHTPSGPCLSRCFWQTHTHSWQTSYTHINTHKHTHWCSCSTTCICC